MTMLPYIPAVLQIPCKTPAGAKEGEYSNSISTLRVLKKAYELLLEMPKTDNVSEEDVSDALDGLETMMKKVQ